jgi:hypothetical protein
MQEKILAEHTMRRNPKIFNPALTVEIPEFLIEYAHTAGSMMDV